jgi:hypothetical protein
MFLDTKNKNMHGLGVGISSVFKNIWALPAYNGIGLPRIVMTYILSDAL